MPAKKSPPKKDPPKPRVYPKSVPPKNIPAKTGNAVPREVQDAQNRPPATRTTPISRNTLLPWLALGFGPVKTSGARLLCGINALWRSYIDARDALLAPGAVPIARHKTQRDWLELRNSQIYQDVFEEYLAKYNSQGALTEAQLQEERDNFQRPRDFDYNNLNILLQAANRSWGTDFDLGVITQGYNASYDGTTQTWDTNFTQTTNAYVDNREDISRPILWIWNNNNSENNKKWGGTGGFNHWEGFGAPARSDASHRSVVRNWNLGGLMRRDIAAGVWRVTQDQQRNGVVIISAGAFVHAATPPGGVKVPEGSRWVATADERMAAQIPEDQLVQIALHPNALNAIVGGAALIDGNDAGAANNGNNINEDQKNEFDTSLKDILDRINKLAFFRAIIPTNRIGGDLSYKEIPPFNRDFDFNIVNGQFFLDLGLRHGPWVRVRHMDSMQLVREGWAHARCLQALENAWNLPSTVPFNVIWNPVGVGFWDDAMMADEQRKRGLKPSGDEKKDLDILRAWDAARTASLPMGSINAVDRAEGDGVWSDGTDVLVGEVVLQAETIKEGDKIKIVSFDRETARIRNHNFSPLKDSVEEPWGIKMTPEELDALMKIVRQKSSAAAPAPENAGEEGEPAGNGGTKHPRDEDEDDEDPKAPSKPKTKKKRPASKRPRR
ncbi:hypothetical protein L207DRAFT_586027 [Hyaloscypha variabilis F]|uniref:Uncharacterized protein n=1 Tax=Hyaloscypha variabilis (strain UAMH 11265 / GT02V1 / F) TaxID=1149755 RepID=A0A2J6RGS1_HYAVF|nr:hypothetical protein L207DRAFT_586027 [Hyaloscypha variabilis F]